MTGRQRGPVEHGSRPGPVPMDVDRALADVAVWLEGDDPNVGGVDPAALQALTGLANAARAYVRGPSPGRLEALAATLQEPVGTAVAPVDVDAVVQAYLTERDMLLITRHAATRLGIIV